MDVGHRLIHANEEVALDLMNRLGRHQEIEPTLPQFLANFGREAGLFEQLASGCRSIVLARVEGAPGWDPPRRSVLFVSNEKDSIVGIENNQSRYLSNRKHLHV